jgi:hypothetical protein
MSEAEFDAFRPDNPLLCQIPDPNKDRVSRLSSDILDDGFVPEPDERMKGNNGIGNDEVGDPPGGGNTGNDVEGVRTAQTTGPGAKGPNGTRSDNQNGNSGNNN